MRVRSVFIRHYKSFNFDYLRKFHGASTPRPWEHLGEAWEPYVRVPLDPKVTAIVGANESGKSHLLTGIERALTGEGIVRDDFCRYSKYFAVRRGEVRHPDFGIELGELSESDAALVRSMGGLGEDVPIDRFFLFREDASETKVYLPNGDEFTLLEVSADDAKAISETMPLPFRIDPRIPLPDSVPLHFLASESDPQALNELLSVANRSQRHSVLTSIIKVSHFFKSEDEIKKNAKKIAELTAGFNNGAPIQDASMIEKQYNLARSLLFTIANVDPSTIQDLQTAISEGRDGYANAVVQRINEAIATSLNFPNSWVQDKDFRLVVAPREHELVITVRDRTQTEYSFNERSHGLKYFLSYYIQLLAHDYSGTRDEILLMDEPDAFLSSQGQQDLLQLFNSFAEPNDVRRPVQVVYVTHSPFLIDKNHGERIRVLEKGIGEEGTRVVRDVARNHYEPLRSSMGSFVAETMFIGNANLIVEGQADQVLLAGVATLLRSEGASKLETLDLNRVTIVPAGSASTVPYMVFLARGRDVDQPAVVALLDSDQAGRDAKKDLQRGGPRRKQLLRPDYVLEVGDLHDESEGQIEVEGNLVELEDLIPLEICAAAATRYIREIGGIEESEVTVDAIRSRRKGRDTSFDAAEKAAKQVAKDINLDKVGFARCVIDHVQSIDDATPGMHVLFRNFSFLFRALGSRLRNAERELLVTRVNQRVSRLAKAFLDDHPTHARQEQAQFLIDEMESVLDDTLESDSILVALQGLRREFVMDGQLTEDIANFTLFRSQLEQIPYAGVLSSQDPESPDDESPGVADSVENPASSEE